MQLDSWPYSVSSERRPPFRLSTLVAGSLCRLAGEAITEVERLHTAESSLTKNSLWPRGFSKARSNSAAINKQLSSVSRFLRQFRLDSVLSWNEGKLQTIADQATLLWASFLGHEDRFQALARALQALSTQVAGASKQTHLPMIREGIDEGVER